MRTTPSCVALLIVGLYALSLARAEAAESFRSVQFEDIPAHVMTDGFLEAHPDLMSPQRHAS